MALRDKEEGLKGKECKVVIIAAGTKESGKKWQKDYSLSFSLIVDPDRKLYRLLGRKRSATVWALENIIGYSEDKLAGIPQSPVYEGDDLHIMGGDYIVDDAGKLLYAYPSKTTKDRPTVEQLFTALVDLSKVEQTLC